MAQAQVKVVKQRYREADQVIRQKADGVTQSLAYEIASVAAQLAPKGKRKKQKDQFKRLRETIGIAKERSGWKVIVMAPYAGHVEFGTRNMPAQPYLRPAVNAVRKRGVRRFGQIQSGLSAQLGMNTRVIRIRRT